MHTKKLRKKTHNKTKKNHSNIYDVVIIGAGFSGLYCGYKLKDKFKKILIVEKDNKIGGRILSYKKKINNKYHIFEQGANRFSRYHHPLMLKLINELKLSKYMIPDVNEVDNEFIFSHLFHFKNNINVTKIFKTLVNLTKNIDNSKLKKIKFKSLCKQYLTKYEFDLTYNLWKQYMRWHRVNYAGNNNSKFRLHPSYNKPFCENLFDKEKNVDKNTPYVSNFHELFNLDSLTALRVINTLLFNKKINSYYRISNGNIEICNRLKQKFVGKNRKIIFNTTFHNYNYTNNIFHIKLNNSTIKSKNLILTLPTLNALKVPALSHIRKYLNYSIPAKLGFVHAVYPKNSDGKYWFHDFKWISTNLFLRHIMPGRNGTITLGYLSGSEAKLSAENFNKLFHSSKKEAFKKIQSALEALFPDKHIPKPLFWTYKYWYGGTHGWKKQTKYCDIYKKIIFPNKKQPVYLANESYSYRGGWSEGALEIANEVLSKIM